MSTHLGGARAVTLALALAVALGVGGCASSSGDAGTAPSESGSPSTDGTTADPVTSTLTATDPWAKAAESGMTGVFTTLRNDGPQDVQVVAVTSPAAASAELHETVQEPSGAMVMREVEGGLTVPAGGERVLEPGGDHLMLMDLTGPLAPGDEVELTLELADGSTIDVVATVKEFAGAQENYQGGDGHGDTEEHGDDAGHEGA